MLAPLNEYYTDEEYEFALRQMYRMMRGIESIQWRQ